MKHKLFAKISLAVSAAATAASADNTFYINQAGYDWDKPITIVVKSDQDLEGAEWTLWYAPREDMTGASVATGKVSKGENPDNWTSNGKFYVIDISGKIPATPSGENGENRPMSGNYHVEITKGSPSASDVFYVGQNTLAEKTLGMVMNYFYNDRASADAIQQEDQKLPVYGSSGVTHDARGGWYDASGDASKYFSHLSYANYLNPQQIPLTVWSLAFAAEHIPNLLKSTSTKATASEEAAYGADFLVRMLDDQGFFYMTVFDNWGTKSRKLCAFSGPNGDLSANYQTAFREGGGMAIAALARISKLGAKGDYTSEQYLAAAQKAYTHLKSKQSIGGDCAYCDDGKENIIDDYTALLAATELFFATNGKSEYMNDMEKRAANLAERISKDGYFWSDNAKTRPFWHASDAGLPLIALIRFLEAEMRIEREPCPANADCALDQAEIAISNAYEAVTKHLDWLISITNKVENPFGYARQTYKTGGSIKDGFFIPHDNESNYWWQGEDARIASLAAAATYAIRALNYSNSNAADKYATDQLDWILGKNPYSTCMMYGIGKKNPAKYSGQSNYATTLQGGIANGITGKNNDGSGIAWDDDGVSAVGFDPLKEAWNNWRWIEQWIPHSTWYLNALVARYNENPQKITNGANGIHDKKIVPINGISVQQNGHVLSITVSGKHQGQVHLFTLNGAKIASGNLTAGRASLELKNVQSGIYMVKVEGLGAKRISVK